jgi:hypothetical protein
VSIRGQKSAASQWFQPSPCGLLKFFSAGQIATSRSLRQFRRIYFFTIFAGKPGGFMNQPALGIGIA